jgi:hypothetical protein
MITIHKTGNKGAAKFYINITDIYNNTSKIYASKKSYLKQYIKTL